MLGCGLWLWQIKYICMHNQELTELEENAISHQNIQLLTIRTLILNCDKKIFENFEKI